MVGRPRGRGSKGRAEMKEEVPDVTSRFVLGQKRSAGDITELE